MARHAAPSAPAGVGRVLGDTYRLLRVIGSGGSGTVYEAEHLRLPRRFAIKVLQPGRDDVDALARFRREAEVVAALSHPHIIEVFDYDIDDTGLPFMVMPLLDGEPLSERLRMGALAPADAAAVVTQMANAITAAHAGGVVHRDLKPSNVFLNQRPDGAIDVTVLDFGISKVLAAHADRTATGMLLGTPGYAAPEQVRGEPSAIGPAADVFALAAIAYEVMTGRRAFDAGTCEAALYKVCHEQPDPMGSPAVDRAVAAGLAKRPEDRPESPERFAAAFAAAVMEAQRCPRRRVSIAARVIASTAAITAVVAVVGAVAPVTVSAPAAKPIAEPSLVSPPLGAGLPAPGRASPEATTVPVPAPVPANARVTLAIDAPGAHATLDGVAVAGTTLVVGPGHHELRITAPGREPVVRELDASHIGSTVVIQLPRRTAPHKSLRDLLER
jgi:serine/threonine-protein kinase